MPAPHLTPDQSRRLGHRMVDFVADYMDSVRVWPVLSQDKPGDVLARLPEYPPESGLGGEHPLPLLLKAAGPEFGFGETAVSTPVGASIPPEISSQLMRESQRATGTPTLGCCG